LRQYPDLTLDLRLSDSVFDLIEGSFDLAIRNSALEDSSLKGRKLADDTGILCASPAYSKENGTPTHPRDLAQHQLIAFKNQTARPLMGLDDGVGADITSRPERPPPAMRIARW
jgi:DNA-binding transcriptional LysR family regulator